MIMEISTDTATAAAAYHYRSEQFTQSLSELQRCQDRWEDERCILVDQPSEQSNNALSHVGDNDYDKIITATADEEGLCPNYNGNCPRKNVLQNRGSQRVELVALPILARRADVALILFRQFALTKTNTDEQMLMSSVDRKSSLASCNIDAIAKQSRSSSTCSNVSILWKEAISSNRTYRNALNGAAKSLIKSLAVELSVNTRRGTSVFLSIQRAMKETAFSILMAGVAASHLLMYHHADHCIDGCSSCSFSKNAHRYNHLVEKSQQHLLRNEEHGADAWSILVNAAANASTLMRIQKEWKKDLSSDLSLVKDSSKNEHVLSNDNNLEGYLLILNEMFRCNYGEDDTIPYTESNTNNGHINNNKKKNVNFDEIERANLVMHTFRSALSVAALATGRLILPKLKFSYTNDNFCSDTNANMHTSRAPKRKRRTDSIEVENQKITKKDNDNSNDVKMKEVVDGSLNVKYTHCDPKLHARGKLVDALSLHVAASQYPTHKRKLLINLREACFNESIEWENMSCALYDTENINGANDKRVGYAWKIRNCLHGLEIASGSAMETSAFNEKAKITNDEVQNNNSDKNRQKRMNVVKSLERLDSSSSRFVNDWLGCVYAQEGKYVRALNLFQSSLDFGRQWITKPDADEETSEYGGLAERRTTVNLALCFLAMGEANAPLELLLHLWMTLTESSSDSFNSNSNLVSRPQPKALLLSSNNYNLECLFSDDVVLSDERTKLRILWKLFQVSSIAQDWSTCLNVSKEIMMYGPDLASDRHSGNRAELALAFALLQCRQISSAREITHTLLHRLALAVGQGSKPINSLSSSLMLSVVALYHADALLVSEQNTIDLAQDGSASHCTYRAIAAFDASLKLLHTSDIIDVRNIPFFHELQITSFNNHAISLILSADVVGALRYFREAAKLATSISRSQSQCAHLRWLLVPTYFNLSLLLLKDGHLEESAESWLRLRGHFGVWQMALHGDDNALQSMKDLLVASINRHRAHVAKRRKNGDAMWDESILEWIPPAALELSDTRTGEIIRIGGVDASQIMALDAVLLKYACSAAERRASSIFRQRVGRL